MDIDQAVSLAERMPARVASVTVEDGRVLIKFWPDMTGTGQGRVLGQLGAPGEPSDADLALAGLDMQPDPETEETE